MRVLNVRSTVALALACAVLGASDAARAQAAGVPAAQVLSARSFSTVTDADIETWKDASGCSFAVLRGADLIGLFDTQDPRKTALFKIDGKLLFIPAAPGPAKGAYWSGNIAGTTLRLIKGKVDPKDRTDGGGQGGQGRMEWSGPAGHGSIAVRWSEGC